MESVGEISVEARSSGQSDPQCRPPEDDDTAKRQAVARSIPEVEADEKGPHGVEDELARIRREREERDHMIAEMRRTLDEPVTRPEQDDVPKAFKALHKPVPIEEMPVESTGPASAGHEDASKKAKCESCGYVWRTRGRREPKECPRCKARLDYGTAEQAGRMRVQKALRIIIKDLKRPRKGYSALRESIPDYPSPEELAEVLRAYLDSI